jgi:hypothetical protein
VRQEVQARLAQLSDRVRDDAIRLVLNDRPGADFDIAAVESYRLLEKMAMGSRRRVLGPVDGLLYGCLARRGSGSAIRVRA